MKKVLIVATVGRFLNFERNDIAILKRKGYEVHCASNWSLDETDRMQDLDVVKHQVDFARSPFSATNLNAFRQLKRILRNEKFEFVHCHTPVGGILTRIAARKYRKQGLRVLYTAHGFHFFKGASWKNWLLFYPIEWICSWWTDVLITINKEDYLRAARHFHANRVEYLHGIGIDTNRFRATEPEQVALKRAELGISDTDLFLLSVGELSRRKNHIVVIEAIARLNIPDIKYYICGDGELRGYLQEQIAKYHLGGQVHLLGMRQDISELCHAADLFVFPSFQEGLPVALMEAIASCTPVICSDIRGNVDLVSDESCMFEPADSTQLLACMRDKLGVSSAQSYADLTLRMNLAENMKDVVEQNYQHLELFDVRKVGQEMDRIYG